MPSLGIAKTLAMRECIGTLLGQKQVEPAWSCEYTVEYKSLIMRDIDFQSPSLSSTRALNYWRSSCGVTTARGKFTFLCCASNEQRVAF
jgi:hypothetical protein